MLLKYVAYSSPLSLSTLVSLFLMIKSYEERDSEIGRYFFYMASAMFLWALSYLLELTIPDPTIYTLLSRVRYVGIAGVPVFWVSFTLLYSNKIETMDQKKLISISLVPAFCLLMLFTNPYHYLFFSEEVHMNIGPLTTADSRAGPFFDLFMYYAYLLVIVGVVVVLQEAIQVKDIYFRQSAMLITGILVPFIGNIIYVFSLVPLPHNYDITVVMFSISGIAIWYAIFQLKFLDILPIAREAVFENISDSIFALDNKNRIVDYNQYAEKMIEDGLVSVEGSDVIGEEMKGIFPQMSDLIKEGEGRAEVKLEGPEKGERKFFDTSLSPVYNKRGKRMGKVIIMRDITQRKEAEERAEFLHSLLRHDLGNKLQITMGFLELLRDSELSGPDLELLEDSLNSIEEGVELIENVRTLNRLESEGMEGAVEPVELKSVVEKSVRRYDDLRKEVGMNIEVDVEEGIRVKGGPLLKESFSNLVENSLKHSDGNEMKISAEEEGKRVVVRVEDDGKGVPDGAKDSIMKKGYQGEGSSGSGLGMHLVKKIVEIYDGNIEVSDSEMGGAEFDICLNRSRQEPS
ncbi:MAG: histidine kinase N-terminal 7TM domain-containing protein [Candidatus Aenigmatarchaeota archaeon]